MFNHIYDNLSTSDEILYYNVFGALDYDVLVSDSYVHYNMYVIFIGNLDYDMLVSDNSTPFQHVCYIYW